MKTIIIISTFLIVTLSQAKEISGNQDTIASGSSDSLEYELLITDIGFDTYLLSQLPKEYYSESYYRSWNQRYVLEWNSRYHAGPKRDIYENLIHYEPAINYGLDLEYTLYHYFRFFEKRYHVVLIPRGR